MPAGLHLAALPLRLKPVPSLMRKQKVPVLPATARGGATAGQVLKTASQASLQGALEPALASDAVLLSDGRCLRQVGLVREASPRSCLVASMAPKCVRLAIRANQDDVVALEESRC